MTHTTSRQTSTSPAGLRHRTVTDGTHAVSLVTVAHTGGETPLDVHWCSTAPRPAGDGPNPDCPVLPGGYCSSGGRPGRSLWDAYRAAGGDESVIWARLQEMHGRMLAERTGGAL